MVDEIGVVNGKCGVVGRDKRLSKLDSSIVKLRVPGSPLEIDGLRGDDMGEEKPDDLLTFLSMDGGFLWLRFVGRGADRLLAISLLLLLIGVTCRMDAGAFKGIDFSSRPWDEGAGVKLTPLPKLFMEESSIKGVEETPAHGIEDSFLGGPIPMELLLCRLSSEVVIATILFGLLFTREDGEGSFKGSISEGVSRLPISFTFISAHAPPESSP